MIIRIKNKKRSFWITITYRLSKFPCPISGVDMDGGGGYGGGGGGYGGSFLIRKQNKEIFRTTIKLSYFKHHSASE